MFQITLKMQSAVVWSILCPLPKFHENPPNTFQSDPATKQQWKQYPHQKWQLSVTVSTDATTNKESIITYTDTMTLVKGIFSTTTWVSQQQNGKPLWV